jgi:hypothetical protein
MLIIGSEALKSIFPDSREPADLDLIVPNAHVRSVAVKYGEIKSEDEQFIVVHQANGKKVEIMVAIPGNAMWMYLDRYKAFEGEHYIDVHGLYSLKKSHVHIPLKFEKHIWDYSRLHKEVGGIDIMPEITKQNTLDIKERTKKKFASPSLKKSVKEFFGQSEGLVKSWFVHDHIHRVMAHYDGIPLYEKMQRDLSLAWCEKDLWEKFSFEDKCKCVLEEAYVIALERRIIPILFGGEKGYFSPKAALHWSMMRVCTTLTSGWFREFATNNYLEITGTYYDPNYVKKFLSHVEDGRIELIIKEPSMVST